MSQCFVRVCVVYKKVWCFTFSFINHEFKTTTPTDKTTCNSKEETSVSTGSAKDGECDGGQNVHIAGDGIQPPIVDVRHRTLCPDSRLWLHSLYQKPPSWWVWWHTPWIPSPISQEAEAWASLWVGEVSLVYILSSNLPVLHSETLSQKEKRSNSFFWGNANHPPMEQPQRMLCLWVRPEEQFCLKSSLSL